jgi:glycosyltransferase involved in cell wall biosynthesis
VVMRKEIRAYGLKEFSWKNVVDSYINKIFPSRIKIALVGPGIMPIPPPGWGAVEILMWDYYKELSKQYDVDIINPIRGSSSDSSPNTQYSKDLVNMINSKNYDFVHIHYDCLYHIIPYLTCKNIAITSHYPYIGNPQKHANDGYNTSFNAICNNQNHYIFALSKKDYNVFYKSCADKSKIFLMLNGSNHEEIMPNYTPSHSTKSIYVGKIEDRKQQKKYCNIPNIDFYGKCDDSHFRSLACYKGELPRNEIISAISNHGNMVLLSTGENGSPLVVKEALMAGLPIVINRQSADDLDEALPFVDIIPDNKLDDILYIQGVIEQNLNKQTMKGEIREYAVKNFSWKGLIEIYAKNIQGIIARVNIC